MKNELAEKLADVIEQNPNCQFDIDNDSWFIVKLQEDSKGDDTDQIADYTDYQYRSEWYSHSNQYGAALAEAMIILLNRRGFKISAFAV